MGTVKYSGPVASFHCPTEATIRSLKVHFSPKQEGSGDPSPENIRPIVGWDGVEVYRNDSTTNYEFGVLGKNKFSSSTGAKSDCYLRKNVQYTLSATSTSEGYFKGWYEDGTDTGITWINAGTDGDRRWRTYTPTKDIVSGMFYVSQGMSECQIELGSTPTTYEPYNPNHTVYGGWVDLITGEVQEEWIKRSGNDLNVSMSSSTAEPWVHRISVRGKWISNIGYENAGGAFEWLSDKIKHGNAFVNGEGLSGAGVLYVYDDTINDASEFIEKYSDTEFAYQLREETYKTYHLAPTQLQTFLGQNNVWSNADYVEVEYDLHETQTILARKQFIIANQPHIVKPAAAPLQNFVTDMAAPLKSCKVYFSPVQEGSGDPSPENVRAISGWTGVEVYKAGENLIPIDYAPVDGKWKPTNGVISPSVYNMGQFPVPASLIYYQVETTGNPYFGFIDGTIQNGEPTYNVATVTNVRNKGFDNAVGHKYALITATNETIYANKIVISVGQGAKPYSEPSGTTLPIDWSSAGTVYGGYVDLVTGEVWETWGLKDLGTVNWTSYSNRAGVFYSVAMAEFSVTSKLGVLCNKYASTHDNVTAQADKTIGDAFQLRARSFAIYDTDYIDATVTEFKTAMSGVIAAYPLAAPTLITTLTSTQLKTLRGTNNIWSNSNGDITVQFWKH